MGPKDGLRNRQDSEKAPLMKADSIYWEICPSTNQRICKPWLGMTWAEDCDAKPKLPWIDSTSFKRPPEKPLMSRMSWISSWERFEFFGTTPNSRSLVL
jgi:hypothetical protein